MTSSAVGTYVSFEYFAFSELSFSWAPAQNGMARTNNTGMACNRRFIDATPCDGSVRSSPVLSATPAAVKKLTCEPIGGSIGNARLWSVDGTCHAIVHGREHDPERLAGIV